MTWIGTPSPSSPKLHSLPFSSRCSPLTPFPLPLSPAGQLTDGASAALLMTRAEAVRRGLPILGIFRSFAAVRRCIVFLGQGQ